MYRLKSLGDNVGTVSPCAPVAPRRYNQIRFPHGAPQPSICLRADGVWCAE